MSKRYRGKTCVYCCKPESSETADHVLARQFVLERSRAGLPKVPACGPCNRAKSQLEHYLTAVMPFGGTHPDATEALTSLVPPRLEKNRKIQRHLADGMERRYSTDATGKWFSYGAVPIDVDLLIELYEHIVRGLAYWHWELLLPPGDCLVAARFIRSDMPFFEQLLKQNAARRLQESIGNGALVYEGAQSTDPKTLTIWKIALMGAKFSTDQVGQVASWAYVLTAPSSSRSAKELLRLVDQGE